MRIFVTGATGFIGRALCLRLQRDGHRMAAWVRDEGRARSALGADVELVPARGGAAAMREAIGRCDAVVNLAGEPVAGVRWTRARRERIWSSRIGTTRAVVEAIGASGRRPSVLVSASAVGYYGDRADERLDESSRSGAGFLAELCEQWEGAARQAEALGVRVVLPRIGLVLGEGGGVVPRLAPLFRLGLGGRLGSGRQWVPWIHLEDLCGVLTRVLTDERLRGPVNATAPYPVTNAELTQALGLAVARPAVLWVPAPALRLALGEAASVVLEGQRAEPVQLERVGFPFAHPTLAGALADLVFPAARIQRIGPATHRPAAVEGSRYLASRPPRYVLASESIVPAPRPAVFDFFSRPENLGAITPPTMRFVIEEQPGGPLTAGARIGYRLRIGGLPVSWRTVIEEIRPADIFVDAQAAGPYRSWWHEHHFSDVIPGTRVLDRVFYALPLGPIGWLVHALFVAPALRRIFAFRRHAIRMRFG